MKLDRYELKAEQSQMVFEFLSEGPKGQIPKLIKYSETALKGFYNLAFGDKDLQTGNINDLVISNNGDGEKVLATVVSSIYSFTDRYPGSWIYATGSTKARTRLYRIGITKYLQDIETDFEIYGLRSNEWHPFEKENDYESFLAKRKIL